MKLEQRGREELQPMSKIGKMRQPRPRRPGYFSACFGRAAPAPDHIDHELVDLDMAGAKKRQRIWSAGSSNWSMFLKKKAVVKMSVVPVDDAAGDPWCSGRCCKSKKWGSAKLNEPNKLPSPTPPANPADTAKKPARKSSGSNPSSPAKRHTAPLPAPPQPKAGQLHSEPQLSSSSRLDSLVGLSIVVVALTMVLICGKICAMLVTSAWLYFMPRLRPSSQPSRFEEKKIRWKSL